MKNKHILVVSQYFYPEQFRINDICTEWVKRGYKVTVLTGIPNYPEGQFYEGYDYGHNRTEEWNGVKIIRIPLVPRGHNAVGLIANYGSFVVSGFVWKCLSNIKADYIFTFGLSPMTQALIGVWYAKKHNVPHYLYVQDLWPESVEIVTGIHSQAVLKPIGKMVDYIYENCTHIFATSPSFVKEIQKRCKNKSKITYWPQYAEDFYRPVERMTIPEIPDDDCFKVIFTGNIGQAQGLEILPKVAKKLEGIKFIIVGDGRNKENFISQIKEMNVQDKFVMISRQPAERVPALLAYCDAAFLSFMDSEMLSKTVPAKLQSYMACGIPIVASACGETKRIILEAHCGVQSEIGDIDGLCQNLRSLMSKSSAELQGMGENARMYSEKKYNKVFLMDEIDKYLEQ